MGKPWKEISEVCGLCQNTIRSFYKRFKKIGSLPPKEKMIKTSIGKRLGLSIKGKLSDDPRISVRKLHKWLSDAHGYQGSKSSVHRYLIRNGFKSLIAKKRHMISKANQIKRLDMAKDLISRDPSYFRNIIWSDETLVKSRSDSRQIRYFARDQSDNQISVVNCQVQGGGFSLMLWGCFSYHAMGPLVVVDGSLTSSTYIDLLKDCLLPELNSCLTPMAFQQDRAPAHSAKRTLKFFEDNNITLHPHPPQSPDLNPIENIWAILKQKLYSDFPTPTSKMVLIEYVFRIWNEIPMETVQKLVDGMHERYRRVIDAKGSWI